jgi:aminoglycoside phosphotransferase family enzyme
MCGKNASECRKHETMTMETKDCSPEQIRECHGDAEAHPCVTNEACEHPERLKGRKPGECSREQIRECHGDVVERSSV